MIPSFDIAIVGSGFGGSLLGMIAKRLGHSVLLLERGQHPRFAIGESSTPLANLLLEQLAHRYDLPKLLPLTKWGTWQKNYPGVGCGLKRGFTFYHHASGVPWTEQADRSNQLLVGASPHDRVADTHWYRPDFDRLLAQEAQAQGVEFLDRVKLDEPDVTSPGILLRGKRGGKAFCYNARFLVDATGPRGFLQQWWGLGETSFPELPPTQALYSHFIDVQQLDRVCPLSATPPYPVDDAAVHHILEGGWIWVLRFNNGITSAGVAANASLSQSLRLEEGAAAWERLLERLPSVRQQFSKAKVKFPFIYAPRLSFRSQVAVGWNWALLPSAAGFVDPLLSTGFPLTLLGIERLASSIEHDWESPRFDHALRHYAKKTFRELDDAALMVAALYANMSDFKMFSALSLLYFAAASFTEMARRLGRPELAGESFLLGEHPVFANKARECFHRALVPLKDFEKTELLNKIYETIDPVDVAGLGDAARRNWYPVQAGDLLKAAAKLSASEGEIQKLLVRCGFNVEAKE